MAIAATGIIILIIFVIVTLGVAALIVYSIFYNRHINKTLNQTMEETDGNRMRKVKFWPSPWIIVLGIACLALLTYSIVVTVALTKTNSVTVSSFDGWHYEGVDAVTSDEIADTQYAYYQKAFEEKTLEGYTVQEVTEGAFTYYLFEQDSFDASGLKPQFLLFVTCSAGDSYFVSNAMLMDQTSSDITEIFGSGQLDQYVLFAGNLGDYAECDLALYTYSNPDVAEEEAIHLANGEQALSEYDNELLVQIR